MCRKYGVDLISHIAPTSKKPHCQNRKRSRRVSFTLYQPGRDWYLDKNPDRFEIDYGNCAKKTLIPCAIGFGISTPEQARGNGWTGRWVIVGSAIVKFLEQYGVNAPEPIGAYVKSMTEAMAVLSRP